MSITNILTKRELSLLDKAKKIHGTIVCHGFTEEKNVLHAWISNGFRDANSNLMLNVSYPPRLTTGLVKEETCLQCDQTDFYCNCNRAN